MGNDHVYVVIANCDIPPRDVIEGIYADGLSALGYEAGRVAWTRGNEDSDCVAFYGRPVSPGGGDTYRIEKWRVEE